MNINLIAKLKNYDEFLKNNQEGDQQKYTMVNHYSFIQFPTMTLIADIKSLTFFLKKIETNELNNFEENLFHILFSRNFHNISQTTELCKKLIDRGVDINQLDNNGRVPLQYLISSKFIDEELEPIYQIIFLQKYILVDHKNHWGFSPLELATGLPYREAVLERLKKCVNQIVYWRKK